MKTSQSSISARHSMSPRSCQQILIALGMLTQLAACGGGESVSAPANVDDTTACSILCVSPAASREVMLKGDGSDFSVAATGSLAASAAYSWDMGDGSAARVGAGVSNYTYALPGMYRVTVTARATDSQGVAQSASKTFQVNVIRPQTAMVSDDGIMAIDRIGSLQVSSHDWNSRLGYADPGLVNNSPYTRNLRPVMANGTAGRVGSSGDLKLRAIYGCSDDFGCRQTFAISAAGHLLAAGNENADDSPATARSTGVKAGDSPARFNPSLQADGLALGDIKFVDNYGEGTSYALRGDGTVWAAGRNGDGQLGAGSKAERSEFFVQMRDGNGPVTNAVQVQAAAGKVYVLRSDGTLWAAGSDNPGRSGYLGVGDNGLGDYATLVPTKDSNGQALGQVKDIAANLGGSVYAVRWDGSLWVAGYNLYRALGVGNVGDRSSFTPALDATGAALTNVASVSVGKGSLQNRAFALRKDGTVVMAGEYASRFGVATANISSGDIATRFAPVLSAVGGSAMAGVVAITQGYEMTYFRDAQGAIRVLGKTHALNPSGVADPVDASHNLDAVGVLSRTRFANWQQGGALITDRSERTTAFGNPATLALTDNAVSPTLATHHGGAYASVAIGSDGQLYLVSGSGHTVNHYAASSGGGAFIPASPVADGLRFKTGLE